MGTLGALGSSAEDRSALTVEGNRRAVCASAGWGTKWTPLVESLGAIAWRTLGRELRKNCGGASLDTRRVTGELSKDSIARWLDFYCFTFVSESSCKY